MLQPEGIGVNDEYDWHFMPADRRDREIVLRIAAARGLQSPAWADRTRSPWERMLARLDRAEAVCEALAARLIGGGA